MKPSEAAKHMAEGDTGHAPPVIALVCASPAPDIDQRSARERLHDAAIELFAVHGFHAIGLRDLAAQAGVQAGSLYYHIENKQSLLSELIESALTDLITRTQKRLAGIATRQARLEGFVQAFVGFSEDNPHRLTLIARELAHLSDDDRPSADELKAQYSAILQNIIRTGSARKSDRDHSAQTAQLMIGMLFGQTQWSAAQIGQPLLLTAIHQVARGMLAQPRRA
jgi:AcrR family transcriptional regulator